MQVGGLVLCGGQSSRMGQAKAWLPFGGETLLARVAGRLSEVVGPVVVVAAAEQVLPPLPAAIEVVRDRQWGKGPLQGLASGLEALTGRVEAAYASSCDVPLLKAAWVRRMVELLGDSAIAVPEVGGRRHPLAGVYRVEVVEVMQALVAEDCLRVTSLFDHVPTRFVGERELRDVDPDWASLRNLNTPEEYQQALRDFEREQWS